MLQFEEIFITIQFRYKQLFVIVIFITSFEELQSLRDEVEIQGVF